MIVLWCFRDLKHNANLWVETIQLERGEIRFSIEDKTISSLRQWFLQQEEGLHAAFGVGPCVCKLQPALIAILAFQRNGDAASGLAARSIQNVR